MFFGTPHGGGNTTLVHAGAISAKVARTLMAKPSTDLFKALEKDSVFTEHLREFFRMQYENYQVVSFYERLSNVSSLASWHIDY
jgi:hypothetical protein